MTVIQGFAVKPRRSLAALATVLAAAGLAVGSGADFTSRSANPANTFTAGKLTADNSHDGAAIFSPSDMTPGGPPQTGTVDIANSGDVGAAFTLTRDQLENTDTGESNPAAFAAKVNLVVTDCGAACGDGGDRVVYEGTLADMSAAIGLGDFGGGEKHRYSFAASLDASAGNEYQGDSAGARFVWDAAQQ